MIYHCCGPNRRALVAQSSLNGIDYLEVLDLDAPDDTLRQRILMVCLLKPDPMLTQSNFSITGGVRITDIKIEWISPASSPPTTLSPTVQNYFIALPQAGNTYLIYMNGAGDFATYTLHIDAPGKFDPLLSHIDFSFKVQCPSDFDCSPQDLCPPEIVEAPDLNYLAKDYASFRRLIFDRMAQTSPQWRERNPADLAVTLIELQAYVADQLSYQQDAVATEAYLHTARRRTSLRRHVRLVDYDMHEGSNARAWAHVRVSVPQVQLDPLQTKFLTQLSDYDTVLSQSNFERALYKKPIIFELVDKTKPFTAFEDENELLFYTWGDEECCLAKGATRATLQGHHPTLQVKQLGLKAGRYLLFEEVRGPRTGNPADADPTRRIVVRLEGAEVTQDPVTNEDITEIRWAEEDALPFSICISSRTAPEFGGQVVHDVSKARGNIVLVDHGLTIEDEDLGAVPEPHIWFPPSDENRCERRNRVALPPRYRPKLAQGSLTFAAPLETDPTPSAHKAMNWSVHDTIPQVELDDSNHTWSAVRHLLGSHYNDRHFVVETEHDGSAQIRFGDDQHGQRPNAGTSFKAKYRIGTGPEGNVGAESIVHVVTGIGSIEAVRNPLPAQGGRRPETMEEVRRFAPFAFRDPERAVTPEDYETASRRHPSVHHAKATFRWTGSWHTVFVTADRFGGRPVTPAFEADLRAHLERFRMAGYDLEVDAPRFVPLEVELLVCVEPNHFRSQVKAELMDVLSNRVLPDGRHGVFHPDRLTFGDDVHLSVIVAAAQSVPGVTSVDVLLFQRWGKPESDARDTGVLEFARLEIPRLDNDPNFPEHGNLKLQMGGGK